MTRVPGKAHTLVVGLEVRRLRGLLPKQFDVAELPTSGWELLDALAGC